MGDEVTAPERSTIVKYRLQPAEYARLVAATPAGMSPAQHARSIVLEHFRQADRARTIPVDPDAAAVAELRDVRRAAMPPEFRRGYDDGQAAGGADAAVGE